MDAAARTPAAAGFVSRLLAFGVDVVVLTTVVAATRWFLGVAEAMLRPRTGVDLDLDALLLAILPIVIVLYFAAAWTLAGQTIGKWLFGVRVVADDGGPVSLGAALLRVLGYLLSALPLYAGFLWIVVDPGRRAWHDRLARTRVVYATGGTTRPSRDVALPAGGRAGATPA